jgi:Uma2 family endonuclease
MMTTPTLHHHETDARHRFSVEEYFALSRLGILPDRTELIEGDIYDMSAHSPRHQAFVDILVDNFKEAHRGRATIFSQSTLAFEGWSPEPDLMVLEYDPDRYRDLCPSGAACFGYRQPTPDEIHLIIEVSDTTLAKDRGIKLRNYAKEGIREYWIVNLVDDVIEVFLRPRGEGVDTKTTYGLYEAIAPLAFPDIRRVWLEV